MLAATRHLCSPLSAPILQIRLGRATERKAKTESAGAKSRSAADATNEMISFFHIYDSRAPRSTRDPTRQEDTQPKPEDTATNSRTDTSQPLTQPQHIQTTSNSSPLDPCARQVLTSHGVHHCATPSSRAAGPIPHAGSSHKHSSRPRAISSEGASHRVVLAVVAEAVEDLGHTGQGALYVMLETGCGGVVVAPFVRDQGPSRTRRRRDLQ